MTNSIFKPIKYDLTPFSNSNVNLFSGSLNDKYPKSMGFTPMYLIPASINTSKKLSILNKSIKSLLTWNYILAINSDGILFMNISYYGKANNGPNEYDYTGKNGFISAKDISYINYEMKTESGYTLGSIATKVNLYNFTIKSKDKKALDMYNNPKNINQNDIIVSGNRFDLANDLTLMNYSPNMKRIENQLQTNFIGPVGVKCRYSPDFKSNIFQKCTHRSMLFLYSANQNYIYLFQVYMSNGLPFCKNKVVVIPMSHIQQEAWYLDKYKHHSFIITSNALVLCLSKNYNHYTDNLFSNNSLVTLQDVTGLDPIEIPAMSRDSYINKQYSRIAKEYIKQNPKSAKWINFKIPFKKENLGSSIMSYFGLSILTEFLADGKNPFPYIMILGFSIYILLCVWKTYESSQVISDKYAIIISIIIAIILIVLFPIFII